MQAGENVEEALRHGAAQIEPELEEVAGDDEPARAVQRPEETQEAPAALGFAAAGAEVGIGDEDQDLAGTQAWFSFRTPGAGVGRDRHANSLAGRRQRRREPGTDPGS